MALVASDLAQKLHDALSQQTDGNGKPTPISDQTKAYADGIIAALKAAVVSNLPGTITGVCAPGAPLSAGAGVGGVIVMTPAPMLAKTQVATPPPPLLAAENAAIVQYISTGLVTFAPGNITGTCTDTPTSPGPLSGGAGSNGTIIGLTGVGAVAIVAAATGQSGPDMIKHYTALINYILANAAVSYSLVTGVCPPGGGPLVGAATGGTIA